MIRISDANNSGMDINTSVHLLISLIWIMDINNSALQIKKFE